MSSESLEEYGMSASDTKKVLKGLTEEIITKLRLTDISKDIHPVLLDSLIDCGYFDTLTPTQATILYQHTKIDYFLPTEVKDTFLF